MGVQKELFDEKMKEDDDKDHDKIEDIEADI